MSPYYSNFKNVLGSTTSDTPNIAQIHSHPSTVQVPRKISAESPPPDRLSPQRLLRRKTPCDATCRRFPWAEQSWKKRADDAGIRCIQQSCHRFLHSDAHSANQQLRCGYDPGHSGVETTALRRCFRTHSTSPDSPQALAAAIELCRTHGAPLQLVTFVFPDYPLIRHLPGLGSAGFEAGTPSETARRDLDVVAATVPDDIQVQTFVRTGGNIAQAVARAEWHDGDLLVLGSAPMGRIARVFQAWASETPTLPTTSSPRWRDL